METLLQINFKNSKFSLCMEQKCRDLIPFRRKHSTPSHMVSIQCLCLFHDAFTISQLNFLYVASFTFIFSPVLMLNNVAVECYVVCVCSYTVSWPLSDLLCLCVRACLRVCVREHRAAIWATATFTICHIPPFLFPTPDLYSMPSHSLVFPLHISLSPSVFILLFTNKSPFSCKRPTL